MIDAGCAGDGAHQQTMKVSQVALAVMVVLNAAATFLLAREVSRPDGLAGQIGERQVG